MAKVDPEFFATGVTVDGAKKEPHSRNRHAVVLDAVHGFRRVVCSNGVYHKPNESYTCIRC